MALIRRLLAFILAFFTSIASIPLPGTDDIITVSKDDARLVYALASDTHVNAVTNAHGYTRNMLVDMNNAAQKLDALVIAGDVTENSLDTEWQTFYDLLKEYNPTDNYVIATGNHDIRLRTHASVVERFTKYYNEFSGENLDKIYFSKEINGYTFVVLGSDRQSLEKLILDDEQLRWLDETLANASATGKPVFVISHQSLRDTHGLPAIWNNGVGDSGHVGKDSDKLLDVLNKYNNIVLISGHLHTGFGQYTYEKVGNIYSVNVPSLGKTNDDGDFNEDALGFVVEVYDNEVIFKARNFATGVYVPEYDITIPVE